MHSWGDKGVDWEGIEAAATYIGKGLRKWGRISVSQYKEKYGTARVYCTLGWWQVHSITHPGYAYRQYPEWLWWLDCTCGRHFIHPLNFIVLPFHKWMYKRYYREAIKRWPHLRNEILAAADYPELLENLKEVDSCENHMSSQDSNHNPPPKV